MEGEWKGLLLTHTSTLYHLSFHCYSFTFFYCCSLSCVPLFCDFMGCSLPGPLVHEISQARITEWVAISHSRGSSRPRDQPRVLLHWQVGSWPLNHLGNPLFFLGQVYKAVSTIVGKWLFLIAEDKAVGWHHQLKGCESEQTLGDGEWQGSLACCSPRGHKESDMTERLNDKEKKHEIGKGDKAETETGKKEEETTERITFKKAVYQNFQIKILIPNTTILFKTVITFCLL